MFGLANNNVSDTINSRATATRWLCPETHEMTTNVIIIMDNAAMFL